MSFLLNPRKTSFRKWTLRLHLWLGLGLGFIISIVCITGSLVVYKPEIEKLSLNNISKIRPLKTTASLQQLYNMVQEKYPNYSIQSIATYGGADAAWNFRLSPPPQKGKRVQVYVDQYRVKILGEDNFKGNFLQIMYDLHADLLLGKKGRLVNGICALLFVLICFSGLILWFPGKGKIANGFKFNSRSNLKGKNYDFHKISGFWTALLLVFVSITGAYFPFKKEYENISAFIIQTPHTLESPKITAPDSTITIANLDLVYQQSLKVIPSGKITFIRFPQKADEHFSVRKYLRDDWGRIGDNFVFIHRNSGKIVRIDRFNNLPIGVKITRSMFPLHFGTFWGDVSRILWILLGLVVPFLFISGFIIWFNKLKKKIA